jgi:hypothetical protein
MPSVKGFILADVFENDIVVSAIIYILRFFQISFYGM